MHNKTLLEIDFWRENRGSPGRQFLKHPVTQYPHDTPSVYPRTKLIPLVDSLTRPAGAPTSKQLTWQKKFGSESYLETFFFHRQINTRLKPLNTKKQRRENVSVFGDTNFIRLWYTGMIILKNPSSHACT